MALDDVAGGDELEAARDVRAQPAAGEVEQHLPMREGLKSFGPMIAQEVAMTTSSPSTTAFRHSCSTATLLRW